MGRSPCGNDGDTVLAAVAGGCLCFVHNPGSHPTMASIQSPASYGPHAQSCSPHLPRYVIHLHARSGSYEVQF